MRRITPVTTAHTSEAVRDRPGVHARLLPNPFLSTVSLGPPSGDGRSIDSTRHALYRAASAGTAHPLSGAFASPA